MGLAEVVENCCNFWMVCAEVLLSDNQGLLQQVLVCVMVSQDSMGIESVRLLDGQGRSAAL